MLPPKIYLHAYAGNEEITRQLLKLNVDGSNDKGGASCCELYFGFAAASNMRNEKKLSNVLKLIPTSRLLIESDGEFLNVSSKSRSSSSSSSSSGSREVHALYVGARKKITLSPSLASRKEETKRVG